MKTQYAPTCLVNRTVEVRTFEIIERLQPTLSEQLYLQLISETTGDNGRRAQGVDPIGHLATPGE